MNFRLVQWREDKMEKPNAPSCRRKDKMDMKKYVGSVFLKPDDLREGPVQVTITDIAEGRFDKPNLEFNDGTLLSLNATNARVLAREYGFESDDWIGKVVELKLGEIEYNGKPQESILIRPISPSVENKPRTGDDMDDSIPF